MWGWLGLAAFVAFCLVGMVAEGNPYDAGPDPLRPENWME